MEIIPEHARVAKAVHELIKQMQIGEGAFCTEEQKAAIIEVAKAAQLTVIPTWQAKAIEDLLEQFLPKAIDQSQEQGSGRWVQHMTKPDEPRFAGEYHMMYIDCDMEIILIEEGCTDKQRQKVHLSGLEGHKVLAALYQQYLTLTQANYEYQVKLAENADANHFLDDDDTLANLDDHPF